MSNYKSLIASKTFWLHIAFGVASVVIAISTSFPELRVYSWFATAVAFATIILRWTATSQIVSITPNPLTTSQTVSPTDTI